MVGWDSMPLDVELMMHESMNVLIFISFCYFFSVKWILMTKAAGSIFSRCIGCT
jgi:hypothetical protein